MNVLIIGAGRVGRALARLLGAERHNVTVVDANLKRLDMLRNHVDAQLIVGVGANPKVLQRAGVEDMDLLVAVTREDETNILACHFAHRLNSTARKICRVRLSGYWSFRSLISRNSNDELVINEFLSPQRAVTAYIRRLINAPGALQVIDFAQKKLRLAVVKAYYGGLMVNKPIRDLRKHLPKGVETRFVAIYRGSQFILPDGDTVIVANDEVVFITATDHYHLIVEELHKTEKPYSSVTIVGGGHVGYRVAQALEDQMSLVKIIDHNVERTRYIAERLDRAVVLQADATDKELLTQEEVGESDVFLALTSSDEANILSSMLAKSLGARKVMTLVNNPDYIELLQSSDIDVALAPDLITISSILSFAREGDTTMAHTLRRGAAEVLEVVVHGSQASSRVIGRCLDEIKLPQGMVVGAVVRDGEPIIAHGDTTILDEDHVIVFVNSRRLVTEVESLFGAQLK